VRNAITIDVEDWFHVCGDNERSPIGPLTPRVRPNIEKILGLLAEYQVEATFFMLGSVAEQDPSIVPSIMDGGHEIASHGYSHRPVTELSEGGFRDEILRTGDILEEQSGRRPIGYRAPQWTLRKNDGRLFEILRREGYRYDSSLNPLPFVGDGSGSRVPWRISTLAGDLVEIPPMVTPSPVVNLPTGGGWGLRFFPVKMLETTVRRYNSAGFPAVFYLHPREMDASGPRLPLSLLRRFVVYGTRKEAEGRLRFLLERFSFVTMEQLVNSWESG
jgi:peptidoglycan-N-acetylglucosamine deacetylase